MIRFARARLDTLLTYLRGGPLPAPQAIQDLEIFDTIIDAAEAALAPEYDPPTVLVDTREQRPFAPFLWQKCKREYLPLQRFMLSEGDYSALGLEPWIRIERKSIADLYGTLYGSSADALGEVRSNEARFREELLRLHDIVEAGGRAYIVVEGEGADLVDYIVESKRRVDPTGAVHHIEKMAFEYNVPLRWNSMMKRWKENGQWRLEHHPAHARARAEWFVGGCLAWAWACSTDPSVAKKAVKRGLSLPWAYDINKAVKAVADAIREGKDP